jgi:hypothetical protein
MALKKYESELTVNTLYPINLKVESGLGQALAPMIGVVGAAPLLTLYGAFEEPTGVTLANIADKMFIIRDDFSNAAFEALPSYIAVIVKSGTADKIIVSSIELETAGTPIV